MNIVLLAGDSEGLESWRLLCEKYEPRTATRSMGLLQRVMRPTFSGEIAKRADELQQWEQEVEVYRGLAPEKVPEIILVAILTVVTKVEPGGG